MVFVHGYLGVADGGDVFDYDTVVDAFPIFLVEEDFVGGNDVVNDRGLADFLRTELTGGR